MLFRSRPWGGAARPAGAGGIAVERWRLLRRLRGVASPARHDRTVAAGRPVARAVVDVCEPPARVQLSLIGERSRRRRSRYSVVTAAPPTTSTIKRPARPTRARRFLLRFPCQPPCPGRDWCTTKSRQPRHSCRFAGGWASMAGPPRFSSRALRRRLCSVQRFAIFPGSAASTLCRRHERLSPSGTTGPDRPSWPSS